MPAETIKNMILNPGLPQAIISQVMKCLLFLYNIEQGMVMAGS